MRFCPTGPLVRLLLALLLAAPLALLESLPPRGLALTAVAFADDDDGGGDDDGDDDDDGERASGRPAGSGRSLFRALQRQERPRTPRRTAARRAPPPPPPVRVADEIVAVGLDDQQVARLEALGFAVADRQTLESASEDLLRLEIPDGMAIEAARDLVRSEAPAASADFNHYYRPGEAIAACDGRHCAAPSLVGWPLGRGLAATCPQAPITIGLIDTAVNPDHAAFGGGRVEVVRLSDAELPASGRQHGTAVAALLVGSAESSTPGLLPTARLIAVDAFHRGAREDDRAEVFDLVRALDLLAQREVEVVNMSLSGPANVLVERLVGSLSDAGTVLVAAAGNGGPKAAPAFPAAYAPVIAVTAVDRGKRAYRRAGRGEHIDLAAPGVEVWTAASIKGARPKTGTSFAAPFVTAAAALMKSAGTSVTPAQIQDALTASAEDLGAPGKDPVYGWGLLNARELCGGIKGGTSAG